MTPQPSTKQERRWLNQVSTELGEDHCSSNGGRATASTEYSRLLPHLFFRETNTGMNIPHNTPFQWQRASIESLA